MRTIRLRDTRSNRLVELPDGPVGIYACGPTVYAPIHVGNARPFVTFALLKRFLEAEGRAVTLVSNVTDVNDKIYAAARVQGVTSDALARAMTDRYRADTDRLGLGRPDREPLATTSMDAIVALIADLVEREAAYVVDGDVWFAVRGDDAYGSLSHRALDAMDQGEPREGSDRKRDPLDFALWKAEKPGEDTAWDAPWGRGRPGWHIECSAMAEAELGLGFAIHGGGNDLVFPHHENEAAQTRMARDGAELAEIWWHTGMLEAGAGEKMSKSVGNIAPLHEVLDAHGRDALVLLLCTAHPRGPLAFGDDALRAARAQVERIREAGRALAPGATDASAAARERFLDALADDFALPRALAEVHAVVGAVFAGEIAVGDDLEAMLDVLGLANLVAADADAAPPELEALREERDAARRDRDFARADALRDELAAAGWVVRDSAQGSRLVRA